MVHLWICKEIGVMRNVIEKLKYSTDITYLYFYYTIIKPHIKVLHLKLEHLNQRKRSCNNLDVPEWRCTIIFRYCYFSIIIIIIMHTTNHYIKSKRKNRTYRYIEQTVILLSYLQKEHEFPSLTFWSIMSRFSGQG